jgi:hypothetical protein
MQIYIKYESIANIEYEPFNTAGWKFRDAVLQGTVQISKIFLNFNFFRNTHLFFTGVSNKKSLQMQINFSFVTNER